MITCDYSYAPDCSECDEPFCRRGTFHSPNDWDDCDEYDLIEIEDR